MRVLVVASELPPVVSGVSRSVAQVVDGLRSRGHRVDVLSAADAPYVAAGEVRLSGIAMRLPGLLRRLDRYDVVNVHGPAPTISDVVLAGLRLCPSERRPAVVYTHHFTVDFDAIALRPLVRAYDRLAQRLAATADHVVVTSASYASMLARRRSHAPISVVPWGIVHRSSAGRAERAATSELQVLFVGQLRPYKGAHVAFDALAGLAGVRLSIVGVGPLDEQLRRRLASGGVGNVSMCGRLDDDELAEAYLCHDVILLPSTNRLEAFGLVLAEGMAAGCVPVASDLPGVRDVVDDCGVLTAPGDPLDVRWAISMLADRPEIVDALRRRATARAARYTIEATVAGYEEIFGRAVMERRARSA